ncbi:MAG: hypothetical protein ACHP65_03865 [Legionellales bacterium]
MITWFDYNFLCYFWSVVMGYSSQNEFFRRDKHQFLSQIAANNGTVVSKINTIDRQVNAIDYSVLLRDQKALEAEFTSMFALLQKEDVANKEQFWLFCYRCASALERFYGPKAYAQKANEDEYRKLKLQIKDRLTNKLRQQEAESGFIESIYNKFAASLTNLITTPFHLSQIRDQVAWVNLNRIYWVFSRLTLTQGLTLANELKLIDKLDVILGTHTDVDKIIATLRAPIAVVNYFSVGLFLARFFIDGALLLRHTFFPSELEQDSTRMERFKHEFYKRHCNFANDLVWATVNFITNFNQLLQISGPVAGYITAAFLAFDVGMAFYKCYLAKEEYLIKYAQYQAEIADYNDLTKFTELTEAQRRVHIELLDKQLIALRISWQTKESTYYFVAAGAALLMIGFTASMIVAFPVLIVVSYFACTVAVAMYLSAGAYSQYKEKSLYLEDAAVTGNNELIARKEYEIARNEFVFTMVKNITVPLILVTTLAICWPAAVVLTAVYLSYELYHAYDQHAENKAVKQLGFDEPSVDGSLCLA